jgi:Fe-S-cluster-containing dehydrogenase component
MMDFVVDHRFINGENAMVINLDRCVGCDDCVRACATTHENNPRFTRNGYAYENAMIVHACMHCTDPVCLIGCPTGAIHREQDTGIIVINDDTCIGCSTCANSCPYNNIKMVNIRDKMGAFVLDRDGQPVSRATKCDLCASQLTGPACAEACPHDALIRVDIRDTKKLLAWLG